MFVVVVVVLICCEFFFFCCVFVFVLILQKAMLCKGVVLIQDDAGETKNN